MAENLIVWENCYFKFKDFQKLAMVAYGAISLDSWSDFLFCTYQNRKSELQIPLELPSPLKNKQNIKKQTNKQTKQNTVEKELGVTVKRSKILSI